MTISRVDLTVCIGCGRCVESCPQDVLRIDRNTGQSSIVYPEDCQTCRLCTLFCPKSAITVSPVKSERPMVGWG